MRYISLKDEELLKSINLMVNMPLNREKLLESLKNHYENNKDDIEAIFSYGFYNFLSISKVLDSNIRIDKIKLILNSYNQAISLDKSYWMIYMFKGVLLISLPEVMQDDNEFIETIETMIKLQKESDKNYNYFFVPYIMIADYYISKNDLEKAIEYIEEAKKIKEVQKVNFKCLNEYFKKPVNNFINRLKHSHENDIASEMEEFLMGNFN